MQKLFFIIALPVVALSLPVLAQTPTSDVDTMVLNLESECSTDCRFIAISASQDVLSRLAYIAEEDRGATQAVKCTTAGCVGFQDLCLAGNNFFVYWDTDGDDEADEFECASVD